jgi:hypothetical protein
MPLPAACCLQLSSVHQPTFAIIHPETFITAYHLPGTIPGAGDITQYLSFLPHSSWGEIVKMKEKCMGKSQVVLATILKVKKQD